MFCSQNQHEVCFLVVFLMLIPTSYGANILCVFPIPSYSHQLPALALSKGLASKGHNVSILTTDPYKKPIQNLRIFDFSSMYKTLKSLENTHYISIQKRSSPWGMLFKICSIYTTVTNFTIGKEEFAKFIRAINGTKFDVIIVETIGYSFSLGIRHLVGNPPIIGMMTVHSYSLIDETMANPNIASYIPSILFPFSDKMGFIERFENFLAEIYIRIEFYTCILPAQEKFLKKIFPNIKESAEQLEHDKSLLLVTSNLATGYSRPIQPNVVYVGPLHIEEVDTLPQDLKIWMDEAKNGIIYFSFGSNVRGTSVPDSARQTFIEAFKRFPNYRVLWKWEADTELPGKPENVLTRKWFPQKSILAHPKVKVFISQAGLQSFQEAIYNIVPILGVPIFGDQDHNAKKLVESGAGLRLEITQLTTEAIYESLNSLLTNPSFKDNMKRLSSISQDTIMPSIETAIWWVEYVIRHNGAPHLKPGAMYLRWYQHYMLDVIGVILIIILFVTFLAYYFIDKLLRNVFSKIFKNVKLKVN